MRRLPAQVGPGTILKLLGGLDFGNYEVVLNVYPQDADRVVKALDRQAAQLEGEARTNHKERESLLNAAQADQDVATLVPGERSEIVLGESLADRRRLCRRLRGSLELAASLLREYLREQQVTGLRGQKSAAWMPRRPPP